MNTAAPHFDLIPAEDLRVDQADFKASKWKRNNSTGPVDFYSVCYAWEGGKWEGFVSIRLANHKPRAPKPLPKILTDCLA